MKNIILALRTFKNYRLYSVINIVGLSLSLACTIVISRYIYREITIDTHNENFDRIYATTCEIQNHATRTRLEYPWNLNNESGDIDPFTDPAIVEITKIITYPEDNLKIGDREFDADVMVTDSNFLKIFSYQLELGDRASALHNSSGALISKDFADKHFKDVDPIGKTMRHSSGQEIVIEGVVADPSSKTLFDFDVIISDMLQKHWSSLPSGFVLVTPNTSIEDLNKRNSQFMEMRHWQTFQRFQYVLLDGLYFNTQLTSKQDEMWNQGNRSNIMILSVVSLLVLLIGIFNFINIYTVLILRRGRETGVKKIFGASISSIVWQIITMLLRKYYLLLAISFVIAMPLAWVVINCYMQDFATKAPLSWWIYAMAALITASISLLTLLYQTIKAARTNPAVIMKSE